MPFDGNITGAIAMKQIICAVGMLVCFATSAVTLNSTALDDSRVLGANIEQGNIGGVPVGTIITWPTGTNPEDPEN